MHNYPGASDISPHSSARGAIEDASGLSPLNSSTLADGNLLER